MLVSFPIKRGQYAAILIWAALVLPASTPQACLGDDAEFRVFDGFDNEFELNWEPVRHDPTHVSLTTNPGKLTITTQRGTLGFDETRTVPTKNVYVIGNPADGNGDFVVTTCVESFKPTRTYQQAGLLIYDDDDNYLKYDFEFSGSNVTFKHMRETNQSRVLDSDDVVPDSERIWLRITKRGNVYERAFSTDGKQFVAAGERAWGDGAPQFIGIVAKNGGTGTREEIDAVFDFFEVRSLTEAEKNDPRYAERKRLQGSWDVTSSVLNGKELDRSPLSAFVFDGGIVTFSEKTQTVSVDFTLDPTSDPKEIMMAGISQQANQPLAGIYSLDDNSLTICLSLVPSAPAPSELKSEQGSSRLLLELQRKDEQTVKDKPEKLP